MHRRNSTRDAQKRMEFQKFFFEVKGNGFANVEIKACDYAHAIKQLKKWAKRDGFEIIGNKKGCENQVNY